MFTIGGQPAMPTDIQDVVSIKLLRLVDGLHHAMTVVLGIERHMTGAFMAHGIVAHLIHDDLQQVIAVARTLLVVVHQHQSVVGTVSASASIWAGGTHLSATRLHTMYTSRCGGAHQGTGSPWPPCRSPSRVIIS